MIGGGVFWVGRAARLSMLAPSGPGAGNRGFRVRRRRSVVRGGQVTGVRVALRSGFTSLYHPPFACHVFRQGPSNCHLFEGLRKVMEEGDDGREDPMACG